MEPVKKNRSNAILVTLFIISFALAIGASYYRYFYTKDYDYLVEASCDPLTEGCHYRSCENADDCPPNQLSVYKVYHVNAGDFARCADNSCKQECESGAIACEPIACDADAGDTCEPIETLE